MNIKELHLKLIAIGLLPIFIILTITLPDSTTKTAILGGIVFTAFVVSYIGMSMQRKEPNEHDELLAIPPKKS